MIYANLVQVRKLDSLYHSKQNLDGIFRPRPWSKEYSKLRYDQITSENMRTKLIYFGHIILFLFLTYKMKDFCNLSMSCALFENFSGFIGFFDNYFLHVESDYNFKRLSDDPQKGGIISYLRKMFDKDIDPSERAIWWNILLNNYVVFVVNEVARREGKKYEESFSDGKWGKNKWVAEMISSLPDLSWLQAYCPYDNEFVDDSLYQMLKINSYFESEEGKKSISKLHRIYCNRESKQIKKLRGNGPYTVKAVRLAKIRIKRPMIRIRKSILHKNITNNVKKRDKIRTCRYAAIIRRPTIRTEKSILRKNITNSVKRDRIFTCRYVIKPVARWFHRQKKFAHWKSKILRHPEFIKFWSTTARPQEIEALKKAAKRQKNVYGETSTQEGSTPA